jgi:hypothetical protein
MRCTPSEAHNAPDKTIRRCEQSECSLNSPTLRIRLCDIRALPWSRHCYGYLQSTTSQNVMTTQAMVSCLESGISDMRGARLHAWLRHSFFHAEGLWTSPCFGLQAITVFVIIEVLQQQCFWPYTLLQDTRRTLRVR